MSRFKLQNPLVKKLKLNCNKTKQGLTIEVQTSLSVFVKLCVHFVSVCLKVQKWTQTDTKVTFK